MKEIVKIIREVQATSSRIEKEKILKKNRENVMLQTFLKFVYNPYIITGLNDKKIKKFKMDKVQVVEVAHVADILYYVSKNNTGKDKDIKQILGMIKGIEDLEIQGFLTKVVTKTLKIGATAKTLNKIWGEGFIPEFNVMLAESYFKQKEGSVTGDQIVTVKIDGIRCIAYREKNNVKMFSRQGQPIEGCEQIKEEILQLPEQVVYDGELVLKNDKKLSSDELYRETVKVVRKDGIKKNCEYLLFDMMPLQDFTKGLCDEPCIERKTKLNKLIVESKLTWIKDLPILYKGNDMGIIMNMLDKVRAEGKEGLMLNRLNAAYECKRTKNILKLKVMETVDCKVVGVQEGDGRNKGKLGAIIIDYRGYNVGVGSGFSDSDRVEIFNNKHKYINSIVEIQYFEESQNQEGGISLRFPVFKCFRPDKNKPSYF